jgi:hypothetical protein
MFKQMCVSKNKKPSITLQGNAMTEKHTCVSGAEFDSENKSSEHNSSNQWKSLVEIID